MSNYVCSNCGEAAYYDGRCGDGPVLTCNCVKRGRWINDGRGGYMVYRNDPKAVDSEYYESWDNPWENDRR